MQVAVFGLGKMGMQIAKRLHANKFEVLAYNRSEQPKIEAEEFGIKTFGDISSLVNSMSQEVRVYWLMLPHEIVEEFLNVQLAPFLKKGDVVIDGGNSFYKDTMLRAEKLKGNGVSYFDCGVSGGVWGFKNGFALMCGGPREQWSIIEPIMKTLSSGENYGLVGGSGAGHFVKMVHNGIEYGMMEAIAEGYGIMNASPLNLDLLQVTKIYQQGTVVRSWLIDLVRNIFENENIEETKGVINMLGEGEWTVKTGKELGVDVRVLEDSVNVRKESKDEKNQNKFSNKIVALLRKQFGGHSVIKK